MNLFDRVCFVLVEPSQGGNVGSAARALANMGFSRLRLVRPVYSDEEAARRMAVHAYDRIEKAERFDHLADALADRHWVVATTGRGRAYPDRKPPLEPDNFLARLINRPAEEKIAVVFGPERIGLTAEQVGLCSDILRLPSADEYPVLNLAQAVLLVAYEIRRAALRSPTNLPSPSQRGASVSAEALDSLIAHCAHTLGVLGFLNPQNPRLILDDLRHVFSRAGLVERELAILRGVLHKMDAFISQHGGPPTPNQIPRSRS